MSVYSTFTIYENEMRRFIQALAEQSTLDIPKITDWIYNTGVTTYIAAQGPMYHAFVKQCQEKYNHRPLISPNHIQGQHYTGLVALMNDLINTFSATNPYLKNIITTNFAKILLLAITNHNPFIEIESQVASELNELLDNNPPISPLEKTMELFEAKRAQHPELEEDFKNKLTLMNEFLTGQKESLAKIARPHQATSNNPYAHFQMQKEDRPMPSASTLGNTGPAQ
ncbi:hypothetical protein ACFORL_05650 [Legionella dresdenensis]|uniref:VipA n=1 Tax=Legionella dresdenensis TaxID=450200 RepID=A0ABV8CF14_9GAMM